MSGEVHALATLTTLSPTNTRKCPCTNWIGGWVSTRAHVNALEKQEVSFPCSELNHDFSIDQSAAYLQQWLSTPLLVHSTYTIMTSSWTGWLFEPRSIILCPSPMRCLFVTSSSSLSSIWKRCKTAYSIPIPLI
jgi:hypothetical protein